MGFFKKIFGKQDDVNHEGEKLPIYFVGSGEDYMERAFLQARESFGYFWRELYWERRRIVPALDFAMVKICFMDEIDGEEVGEHMWIDDVEFDGERVTGTLVNEPNDVQNVKNGDRVSKSMDELSDWMFAIDGRAYGAFSVQAMRSKMQKKELKEHDEMWALDFGDFNDILVVHGQKEHPENLVRHPMDSNMSEKVREYISANPNIVTDADERGYTQLHHEALAGNLSVIEVLLECGADKNARTANGKTPLDFAKQMNWEHLVEILS